MKRALLAVIGINLLFLCCSCGLLDQITATNTTSVDEISSTSYSMLEKLINQPYYDFTSLKLPFSSDRKALITKAEKYLAQEPQVLTEDSEFWSGDYYAITSSKLGLSYYGETKDNRPHGFGVIKNGDTFIYAGEFTKGRYDGYGIEFHIDSGYYFDDPSVSEDFVNSGYVLPGDAAELYNYLENYALYEGEWEDGERSGEGTLFYPSTTHLLNAASVKGISNQSWVTVCYPVYVTTGETKKGEWEGDVKEYIFDQLMYDGEYDNGERDGDGVEYHLNKEVKYDGAWDNGYYDGKGTLYDESGTKIYSGEWDRGDYAS